MRFISILLREGRKEDLKKKYSEKFSEDDLNFVLNISDLQDFNHKYTDFILKSLNPENLEQFIEDLVTIVKDFDKYNSQLEKKDINQYSGFAELAHALRPVKAKEKERELEKLVDKIYEDDKFLVVKPKTQEASCKYGSNTKWCTTTKGGGHFERYTSGGQALYYIINKANSTNQNYSKIAVHFDGMGNARYWDSQDNAMDVGKIEIINYAFPEIFDAINSDYKKIAESSRDKFLKEVFNSKGTSTKTEQRFLGGEGSLVVTVEGFETIDDLGPGHAQGELQITLSKKLTDKYTIFITYKSQDRKAFSASIGFMGTDDFIETTDFIDLGLEGWGIDSKYTTSGFPQTTAESIRNHIANRVMDFIIQKPELQEKVVGSAKVWNPHLGYGYTFGKNKGLIKKLVDWLDEGNNGNRLDFLVDIGTFEKITKDGKTFYKRPNSQHLYRPSDLRGQYSSFFASATLAGILKNVRKGRNFMMAKGPNFDAFKKGELKAL